MTGLERLILDLVEMAETPLYSTYRWLGRRLGRDLQLGEFLRIVNDMVSRDLLRLWLVESSSDDRTEIFEVPANLESRYLAQSLDERYDPFGFSLTTGQNAEVYSEPDWEARLDFDRKRFTIELRRNGEAEVVKQLMRCYPHIVLSVESRLKHAGGLRVSGTLLEG